MKFHLCAYIFSLLFISLVSGEEFRWPHGYQSSGSFGSSHQDEYHHSTDGSFPEKSHNPDAHEQQRLIVEWGTARMGFDNPLVPGKEGDRQYWTLWKDDASLRPDRRLAIRGRLLIKSPDGKTSQPIDWLQGIRVIVSRSPEKKHDWSRRQEFHEAVWSDFVIWDNGEFIAIFPPGEILRSPGKDLRFQVAVSLGEKKEKTITWRNTFGVLPQSVSMLVIPGPPPISETIEIINGAPSYSQVNFNPAKLVRTVNHLQSIGKDRAIAELRTFLKMARDSHETVRIDNNIDTSDRTCLLMIVRLLCEGEMPFAETVESGPDSKFWPFYPLSVQDDLPFFLQFIGNGPEQLPERPSQYIDWAEEHGKFRAKPLSPSNNPIVAADRLSALPQTQRLLSTYNATNVENAFFKQAWNIIEDADPAIPKPKPLSRLNTMVVPDWGALKKTASRLDIRWDPTAQKYLLKK